MIGIVASRADEASERIADQLLAIGDFEERSDPDRADADGGGTYHRSDAFELRWFDDLHLELDGVAGAFEAPEYVVFASRHSGDTGPLLSAHVTGNVGEAAYGGADHDLAAAPPSALATVVERLAEHAPAGYDVSLEATHHGPSTVGAPSMFVELGSGPEQWADLEGARAVARAILDLADVPAYAIEAAPTDATADVPTDTVADAPVAGAVSTDAAEGSDRPRANDGAAGADARYRHVVGFGGGHYAPRFTRVARETDWAVGHVAADWSLDDLGDPSEHRGVIAAVFEQSAATHALVADDRPHLEALVRDLGYRVVGERWLRETTGVPLALVDAAEERLGSVADGLRFGEPARDWDGTGALVTVDLPTDLLARAQGIDREAVLDALATHCVAYQTEESGTRAGERALVWATNAGWTRDADRTRDAGRATDDGHDADPDRSTGDDADGSTDAVRPAATDLPEDLLERLLEVLRTRYDDVTVEADRIVATETAFDPSLAHEAGVPEGPAFGELAAGEPVEVDGETVQPEDVTEERRDVFEL